MVMPSNHRLAERKLIRLVISGEWEIDEKGYIWRNMVRKGLKGGGSHLIPVKKRRVEKKLPLGYLMVRATIDGKRINGLAHRLVWQDLYGDIPEGMIINHKNGLKDDCRPENLILSTYSENAIHAHDAGLKDQYGQKNPAVKLTDNQVAQIRLAYASGGYTMKDLGDKFNISFGHVSDIVRGKGRIKQGGPTQDKDLRHCACDRDIITGRFIGKVWNEYPDK